MGKLRAFWRNMFDIREGEGWRVTYMGLYMVLVLFAYYILKPVSRGMFLARFDIDDLPYLYILIAFAGGAMAYAYTKIFINASLKAAVTSATFFMAGTLSLIWWLLSFQWPWMLYFFNAFVSLFSITLVSQGWMVASNLFTTREAKRLYGILGLGAVVGAAFGGSFTALVVHYTGTRNLLLVSVGLVLLAYGCFRMVLRLPGVSIREARGAEAEDFALTDVTQAITRYRHLQVIIAIIALTYIVDVTVDFQFNAMAKAQYPGQRDLVAFLGTFNGIWLNLATFTFQAFLTALVISRFGVGGALQIMPVSISIASVFAFGMPGLFASAATRLTEAATRYTFNKTGMELLYLPLPIDLRNRTKAFTDIFVDRFARGIGGMLLIVLTQWLNLSMAQLSLVVIGYCAIWIFLSINAQREYVATVRKRLERGRLDLQDLRISVTDAATIRLLEEKSESGNARQAAYALSLLAEARNYPIERRLDLLVSSKLPEVRGKVFEIAQERGLTKYTEQALAEVRNARTSDDHEAIAPAVSYVLAVSDEREALAGRLLAHTNRVVSRATVESLSREPEAANKILTKEWIEESATSPDAHRRALAAIATRVRGDAETNVIHGLLRDADPKVAAAASLTAGTLQNRTYLEGLVRLLPNARLRGSVIDALAMYGERIVGTLGDVMLDTTTPLSVRKQIPRVLRSIPSQRTVDMLIGALGEEDLVVRSAVVKALSSLREHNPKLNYGKEPVTHQIMNEARSYYEMSLALAPFRESGKTPAARLLVETLEGRLRLSLERLFRLLGLRYPPREIYAAYLAVNNRKDSDRHTAAVEFLDNVLDRDIKRIVMPLLDEETRINQVGQDVFGLELPDVKTALRELMRSGDTWLVACAIATAAELRMNDLRSDIESVSGKAGGDVTPVAQSALAVLA